MKKEDAIKAIVDNGGVAISDVNVTNVTVDFKGNLETSYVNLKFDKKIKAIEEGKEIDVDFVNLSAISVIASLKEYIGSGVYHHLKNTPTALEDLLDEATLVLYQEKVAKDATYKNPFSDSGKEVVIKRDTYITNIGDVELSKEGKALVKQIKLVRNLGAGIIASI